VAIWRTTGGGIAKIDADRVVGGKTSSNNNYVVDGFSLFIKPPCVSNARA